MTFSRTTAVAALWAALLPFVGVSCLDVQPVAAELIVLPDYWGGNHSAWAGTGPVGFLRNEPVIAPFTEDPNGWQFVSGGQGRVDALVVFDSELPPNIGLTFAYRAGIGFPWVEVQLIHQATDGLAQHYSAAFAWEVPPDHSDHAQARLYFDGLAGGMLDMQLVPEPGTIGVFLAGAIVVLRRRQDRARSDRPEAQVSQRMVGSRAVALIRNGGSDG